ncbi:hypothetical protein Y032_0012g1788 [Ancylostoma ceylanicum]|uniref:Uncharacterized protein n=1 Tax=Ancylostoma ceylanicum TaxID=53326 RepID=A0A016VET8_9BILA|nr:hypothetical protein Y032_0012g1788 [Ancylostoma ceylanicum]
MEACLLRLWFSTNTQDHCTSIPVFTRANHRRLYFGNVYNVTGYIFMNAFAFAGSCTCDSNACCGSLTIKEFLSAKDQYAYTTTAQFPGKTPSDVDQTFYIANVELL